MRQLAFILILTIAIPANVLAAMYKWVDENGEVHYSDRKPLDSDNAQEIKKQGSGISDEEASSKLESLTDEADSRLRDREDKAAIAEEQATRDETIKKNCEIARKNLTLLTSTARVTLTNENGEEYFLPDEEKESKILDAQAQVSRYCN